MRKYKFLILLITCLFLTSCHNELSKRTIVPIIKEELIKEKPTVNLLTINLIPYNGTPQVMVKNLFERLKLVCSNIALQNSIALPTGA